MPFYLDEADVVSDVVGCGSVLIVPCRFCPAASMAVRNKEPYIEFPRRLLKTVAYERLINRMRDRLQNRGVNTSVFKSKWLHQFVLCMWSAGRRRKLLERAKEHDALVVMGCEVAVQTVREAVKSTTCRVIPGMNNKGLMSIRPKYSLPCRISLELESVSPILLEHPAVDPPVGRNMSGEGYPS